MIAMKLNKKGYMLVEIIVSFALAFSIAIYLFNLTIKFKDTNEDIYYSTKYLKDKNLITRNIMEDLERGTISNVSQSTNTLSFKLIIPKDDGTTVEETRNLKLDDGTIYYGKYDTNNFVKTDVSYYQKILESSLIIGNIDNCSNLTNGYFCIRIPITSMYNDNNYDIKLFSSNVRTPPPTPY